MCLSMLIFHTLSKTAKGIYTGSCSQTEKPPNFGKIAGVRMVKPWHEWMFILFPRPDVTKVDVSDEQYLIRI